MYGVVLAIVLAVGTRFSRGDSTAELDPGAVVKESMDDLMKASDPQPIQRYRLKLGPEVYRIGAPPRNEAEEFAGIRSGGGVLMIDGSAVVGDALKLRLVHIGPDGKSVRVVGRSGSGPGEFKELISLFHSADGDSTIYVLDNALHRISRYRLKEHELELAGSWTYRLDTQEACGWNDGYVTLRYDAARERIFQLHSFTSDGMLSFGRPLTKASHRLNESILKGNLLCVPRLDLVLFATVTGDLIAIHPSGAVSWRIAVSNYLPVGITELGGGVVRYTTVPAPENRSTVPGNLLLLDDSLAVLQIKVFERRDSAGKSRVAETGEQTRLIDLRTGQQLGQQDDLPEFLDIRGSAALSKGNEPEPWVALSRLSLVRVER